MVTIVEVQQTPFLADAEGVLEQLIRVTVRNGGPAARGRIVYASGPSETRAGDEELFPPGDSRHDVMIPEPIEETEAELTIELGDARSAGFRTLMEPPVHWVVHVVQASHHDIGYTSLPKDVLSDHRRWLAEALEMAAATDDGPPDARFRIVLEQYWSVGDFLEHASAAQASELHRRLREGRFELTALFGNMTTELCGHESLVRSMYPAFSLARRIGVRIRTAEHDDIPGFAWGLSEALVSAGVEMICPGIPNYYDWGGLQLTPHWDQAAIFGYRGPGAFRWETPSGARLLFWCNNSGCGGDADPSLPRLEPALHAMRRAGYPHTVVRWPVSGGRRDNSPYIIGYAETVRRWNERWAFPRLVSSTNSMFLDDFTARLETELTMMRGGLPGQDYPVGSMSAAEATSANRRNHHLVPAAEALAGAAFLHTGYRYQAAELEEAYTEIQWSDEHTFGHHFPAGPTARAAFHEKSLHAFKAEARAHDVLSKAAASIADSIRPSRAPADEAALHRLVVFNPSPGLRTDFVVAQLREIDNCGSEMIDEIDPVSREMVKRGVLLSDRWHVNPGPDILAGRFRLVDEETGRTVPYRIRPVAGPMDPVEYAAERYGLGNGTKRYGFFEDPSGIRHELHFVARDVPSVGYRSYLLVPDERRSDESLRAEGPGSIENEYFTIEVSAAGRVISLFDKRSGVDWVDGECADGLFEVVCRDPTRENRLYRSEACAVTIERGPVIQSIAVDSSVFGHPSVRTVITLYAGLPSVHVATRVLKGPEPLLDVFHAFPLSAAPVEFSYQTVLAVERPVVDSLPGAHSDELSVQDWVRLDTGKASLLWCPLDTPTCHLGGLRPGRVSPAHRALVDLSTEHHPYLPGDFSRGHVYARLFSNNHGTNFYPSQTGSFLFRYVLRPAGDGEDGSREGGRAARPLSAIFAGSERYGDLPVTGSFLDVAPETVSLLAWKRAEDDRGWIVRLWNTGRKPAVASIRFPGVRIERCTAVSAAEDSIPAYGSVETAAGTVSAEIRPGAVVTLRLELCEDEEGGSKP